VELAKTGKKGKPFEDRLAELEAIVSKLEEGDVSLEDSLELFQRGTEQIKDLARMLDEAERRVEVLTRDMSGSLKTEPLEEGTDQE
jgi:exodeoxyribonuclease VII small subunit